MYKVFNINKNAFTDFRLNNAYTELADRQFIVYRIIWQKISVDGIKISIN